MIQIAVSMNVYARGLANTSQLFSPLPLKLLHGLPRILNYEAMIFWRICQRLFTAYPVFSLVRVAAVRLSVGVST